MMRKKIIVFGCLSILLLFFVLNTFTVSANSNGKFNLHCNNSDVQKGNNFSIGLVANLSETSNISTFRATIEFDSSLFTFKSISPANDITSSELKYSINGNILTVIYLTSSSGVNVIPNNDTEFFYINFKTNNNSITSSSTIYAKLDGISDYNINEIIMDNPSPLTINIIDKPKSDCTLKSLIPSEGSLSPLFDPQIYNYDLNVPYSTKSINFDTTPNNPNSIVKVSRKNLNSAGTTTIINITVKDSTTTDKLIYTINVNRASKPINNNYISSRTESINSNNNGTNNRKGKSNYSTGNYSKNTFDYDNTSGYDYDNNFDDNNSNSQSEDENTDTDSETTDVISSYNNNSDDKLSPVSKTIVVKENKFNIFLAGVCLSFLLFIIAYTLYSKINNNSNKIKNNTVNNI